MLCTKRRIAIDFAEKLDNRAMYNKSAAYQNAVALGTKLIVFTIQKAIGLEPFGLV